MTKANLTVVRTPRRDYSLEIGQAHWVTLEFQKGGNIVRATLTNKYDHIARCWGLEIYIEQQGKHLGFAARQHFVAFDDEFLVKLNNDHPYTEYAGDEPLFAISSVDTHSGVAIVYTTDDAAIKAGN